MENQSTQVRIEFEIKSAHVNTEQASGVRKGNVQRFICLKREKKRNMNSKITHSQAKLRSIYRGRRRRHLCKKKKLQAKK